MKSVETLTHEEASRKNIPTAEYQSVMRKEEQSPIRVAYERRNRDLDPQLVWRGKDEQDGSDSVVHASPLYIQEKVHPKAIIDDLVASDQWLVASERDRERSEHNPLTTSHQPLASSHQPLDTQPDLFADFNGLPNDASRTEFYQHDANWTNRMILGDSLQVMASLAEREGLRGQVQCIYLDPPYGIKFNSNFQWSTTSRDVKDGNVEHITREPEQVKAFRDTWKDGIHSYLTYLRDRLTVGRDLLAESGSIFVQIGEENIHHVRSLCDEVFGSENFCREIYYVTTSYQADKLLANTVNMILWYAKNKENTKSRTLFGSKDLGEERAGEYKWLLSPDGSTRKITEQEAAGLVELPQGARAWRYGPLTSQGYSETGSQRFTFEGRSYSIGNNQHWKTSQEGMVRLAKSGNMLSRRNSLAYYMFLDAFPVTPMTNVWSDTKWGFDASQKTYVVQTNVKVIQRCLLMTTDSGDLILDPTCGSGTTAFVAEQWGRRWITIDTSRVALALARARIMGARFPYYLLADSPEGLRKEAEITRSAPSSRPTHGDIRQGFVYERVPHITLKSIANNAEIDVIWERFEQELAPLRDQLSVTSGQEKSLEEWEVPRERPSHWPQATQPLITAFWEQRIARQKEIDASIAAKADFEYLYDKPYENKNIVRVAGPFTVESLSPHRVLGVDENDELIVRSEKSEVRSVKEKQATYHSSPFTLHPSSEANFASMILENLKTAGVQQAHKEDRIAFTSLTPWPGDLICAVGTVASDRWLATSEEGRAHHPQATNHKPLITEHRCAVFIGPEFGTVSRPDLVAAAREAGDADFDVLIACAFNYDAHSSEFEKLGRIPVLKARMNADLHMADDLKNTGKGNLFVIFGEPDITVVSGQWLVARTGRLISNYEHVKELSGLGCLEEINRVGRDGLSRLCSVSALRSEKLEVRSEKSEVRSVKEPNAVFHPSQFTLHPSSHPSNETGRRAQTLAAVQDLSASDFPLQLTTDHKTQVTVHGVDVFHPQTGEVRSDGPEGIACWFIDTDYNEESFFVRHAYFLGANDPYKSLKTTLKAEINEDAWATLHSDTSRPFPKPTSSRIAVKVINHLGDEVMKVFRV